MSMALVHIETRAVFPTVEIAGRKRGILGLNEANAASLGFALVSVEIRPDVTNTQEAVLSAEPTENADGSWSYKWAVRDKTPEELQAEQAGFLQGIKRERDRRLTADFEFGGKMFQRDAQSLARITGAATLAGFAVGAGAPEGYLRWANPDRDFGWIASDDTVVPMDAQTAFAFGQAAAGVETAIVFAAKALREMDPIPADFAADKWWP